MSVKGNKRRSKSALPGAGFKKVVTKVGEMFKNKKMNITSMLSSHLKSSKVGLLRDFGLDENDARFGNGVFNFVDSGRLKI
jgi:hypothetical protein